MTINTFMATRVSAPFMALSGANPLIAAAMPLILLLIHFKTTLAPDNIDELRRQVIDEMINFEARAKAAQYSRRIILAARYCLCTALDEVVLLTPWGSNSVWAQQTLLSIIHKETWGGERFFFILEKMAEQVEQSLPLLELLYLILSLGFEGKYYNQEKAVHDEVRQRLFRLIMSHRPEPQHQLSPSLKAMPQNNSVDTNYFPKKKILGISFGIILLMILIFNIATHFSARKTLQQLLDIGQVSSALIAPNAPLDNFFPPAPMHKTILRRRHHIHDQRFIA